MTVASEIDWKSIGNTPIAIFDHHHYALIPWARWSNSSATTPRLVTIDHHCDTHEAFLRAAFDTDHGHNTAKQRTLLAAIRPAVEATVEQAVLNLRHDEHIDAAIRSGIIDSAFIIHEQNQRSVQSVEELEYRRVARSLGGAAELQYYRANPRPRPPMTYSFPQNRMFAIDPPSYRKGTAIVDPWPDLAIESDHLEDRLAIFEQALRSASEPDLQGNPYILDIDTDAFRSRKALQPDDPKTFHRLLAGAIGVTVARERECSSSLWLDDQPIDSSKNEGLLERHLVTALS